MMLGALANAGQGIGLVDHALFDGHVSGVADSVQHGADLSMVDLAAGAEDIEPRFVGVNVNQVIADGFKSFGVDLARQADLTLVGRAKGKRFVALSGEHRLVFDADPAQVPAESKTVQRKASVEDDAV